MSLRTKLTALFLLLSILPIVIVGYLAYDSSRDSLEAATLDRLAQTNRLMSDELTRWIANNEAVIGALAQRPLVRQDTHALLADSTDAPTYVDAALRLQHDHLLPALSEQGRFLDLSILEPATGQILLSTNVSMQGKYRESEAFFVEGRSQTFTQNPEYSIADGEVVMYVGTPIIGNDGMLLAVLAGRVDFSEAAHIVSRTQHRTRTEETYLVNAYRFIMVDSRFEADSAFMHTVHTAGVDDCLAHNSGSGHYDDYRGVAVVGAYEWLEEHNFCILTEIDRQEAFGPVYDLRDRTIQIAGGVVVSFAVLGLLVARTITNPVQRVASGARAIGRGDLDYRIDVTSRDEIGALARAFNEMAANLRHSLQETAHGQDLMLALSEAAGAVQRARTPDDVYRLIGDEITRLGFHSMVFTPNQDRSELEIAYHTFDSSALTAAEAASGDLAGGWRLTVTPGSIFERLLAERIAVLSQSSSEGIFSAIPGHIRARFDPVVDELSLTHAIYVPLLLDDTVIGVLLVAGAGLSDADLRAITTFANQAAIALENTRLYKAVQRHADNLERLVTARTVELEQEKRFSDDIINSLPGIFLMYNENGKLIRWNTQFERATRYSAEELAAMPVIDFADANQESDAAQQMQAVYEDGAGGGEFFLVGKNGTRTPYFFSGLRISFGGNTYVISIGIDISERKHAEEALLESEARFRELFNQMPVALMRTEPDGTILEANPAAVSMLGYPDRESLLAVKTPDLYVDVAERTALTATLAEKKIVQHFETRIKRYDGQHIWVQLNIRTTRDTVGWNQFFEIAAQDITERKQAEHQLAESMAELERSNAELEQFAYVASHDLQEPLRMVTSYLQLIERRYAGQLDDKADTFIHYATDGAARMKRLIQDLLVYSRVDRYGRPPEPVNAADIVEQALQNLQAMIDENAARIVYDGLPVILADETQLVMLFQNLIGNAIKFKGDDVPAIRIEAERDGAMWRFAIHDNGIGIDPEYFDRIFIIF